MCRYAFHIYKDHFACFGCRKMFRPVARQDLPEYGRPAYREARLVKCPECNELMHDMGKNFKPPKLHNIPQWRKVQKLHANGCTWHDCGCGGGPAVKTLGGVKPFLMRKAQLAEESEKARQNKLADDRREAKRKKRRSKRKPVQVKWEFYQA